MKEHKIGDVVYVDGMTPMAEQNFHKTTVADKQYKFDDETGEKFPIYKVSGYWYDGRDGSAYKNENSMYYISWV